MKSLGFTLVYVLAVRITCTTAEGSYQLLDKNLLHYEELYYDSASVHAQHVRLGEDNRYLNVHFQAYGRDFNLQLSRDTVPLSQDFRLIYKKTSLSASDLSFLYIGVDTGWPDSDVHGAVIDGTFQGVIRRLPGDTTYHVEPSNRMFSGSPPFHSIIYSEKDYNLSYIFPEAASWVPNKDSVFDDDVVMPTSTRKRRAAVDTRLTNKTCTLKQVTDHTLWRYLMDRNYQNETRTMNNIIAILTYHVRELNIIFGQTTFTLDKGQTTERHVTGINFDIKTIEIMTTPQACLEENDTISIAGDTDHVKFTNSTDGDTDYSTDGDTDHVNCTNSTDNKTTICDIDLCPDDLLEVFAIKEDPDDYYEEDNATDYNEPEVATDNATDYKEPEVATCLTFLTTARVLFRDRNKNKPLLGLTYVPEEDKAGGICSLGGNNGFITLLQSANGTTSFLSTRVTSLVFVHEVGHAFGAQHDPPTKASPGGFYLMHAVAQKGDLPNNKRFSNYSLDSMSGVLSDPSYTSCFKGNPDSEDNMSRIITTPSYTSPSQRDPDGKDNMSLILSTPSYTTTSQVSAALPFRASARVTAVVLVTGLLICWL